MVFSSAEAIGAPELATCLSTLHGIVITAAEVEEELGAIRQKYESDAYFMELAPVNKGYLFLTKKAFGPAVSLLIQQKNKKKLSTAAMETLSIITYKQPVTKPEIEQIRGVNCDYSIQRLLEKDLIQIDGKSESPGRPLLYSTSKNFMDYFKLNSLDQLPQLKDLPRESEAD